MSGIGGNLRIFVRPADRGRDRRPTARTSRGSAPTELSLFGF
jgi:hypothetical protein